MSQETKSNHIGRKISKMRELRGMKQEALAIAMGVSQQTVSNIENSSEIEESKLEEIAKALGVSCEAIRAFSEEAVFNFFSSIHDNDFTNSQGTTFGTNVGTFNPIDKIVELYERLVEAEKEKNQYLEKLLKNK